MAKGKHEAPKKTTKTESTKKAKAKSSGGAKKAVLIIVIVCVVLAAAAFGGGYLAGRSDKIHPNLTLGSVVIGGMRVSDAAAKLEAEHWTADTGSVEVTLPGDYKFTVTAAEAGTDMSCAEAAQAAYDYGHSGNPISDLMCYFKCITGSVTQGDIMKAANADGVRKAVDKALADYNERMGKGYEIDEENAVLKLIKGADTADIDENKLCDIIVRAFADGSVGVNYGVSSDSSAEPDFDKLHEEICAEVLDAKYDP